MSLAHPPVIAWMGRSTHPAGRSRFVLPRLWAIHLYEYPADLTLDGEAMVLRPGSMTLQRPGVVSQYTWDKPSRHLAGHFEVAMAAHESAYQMPAVLEAGVDVKKAHRDLMAGAVGAWAMNPARAAAALWQLLWLIAEGHGTPAGKADQRHPAVSAAVSFIDQQLGEPLTAADVVRAAAVSHNHLIRLFKTHYGMTIMEYLRHRRAQKARHLLIRSMLPIKAIAIECGVPDPQAFNKLIHRVYDASPTALRGRNPSG